MGRPNYGHLFVCTKSMHLHTLIPDLSVNDISCPHTYLLFVSYYNVTNFVTKKGGVMRAFGGYNQARRDI